jgi:alkaline phosphatase
MLNARRVRMILLVGAGFGVASTSPSEAALAPTSPSVAAGFVVVAAGDISCAPGWRPTANACQQAATAALIDGADYALTLGDNQYENGSYANFMGPGAFGGTWGVPTRFERLYPVPGNHEYVTPDAAGYFQYFGLRAQGPEGNGASGYYSFDVPSGCTSGSDICWHLIALNSQLCFEAEGCGPGSPMYTWLQADIAAHPDIGCTLAYYHHPRWAWSDKPQSERDAVDPIWGLLASGGTDIVLNGHAHNYQRWTPMDAVGTGTAGGTREFIVGTGGRSKYPFPAGAPPVGLERAQRRSFGVLALVLQSGSFAWQWVSAAGQQRFSDVGASTCS